MQVLYQRCQSCGSTDVQNLLARERGRAQMVFVRCTKCGEFVARYRLQSYYHHGKGIDSYLRSLGSSATESGRSQLDDFQAARTEAEEQFRDVLEALRQREADGE